MCRIASSSTRARYAASPLRETSAARSAPAISSSDSRLNSNTRQRETMAGVMDAYGFSVVEPINRMVPCSMAGSKESDCVLLKR